MFACLGHLSVWVLGGCKPEGAGGWCPGPVALPCAFPHRLSGCPLRSRGNIVSRVLGPPLPRGRGMRRPEHASHLTLDSLHSTSPFAITDIIIPVYKHGVRSPVYKLWPPKRALSVSPLDLFNLNSEPLSHGRAAVNPTPVYWGSASISDQNPGVSRVWGLETEGPWPP